MRPKGNGDGGDEHLLIARTEGATVRLHRYGAGQAVDTATAGLAGSQTRLSPQARDELRRL